MGEGDTMRNARREGPSMWWNEKGQPRPDIPLGTDDVILSHISSRHPAGFALPPRSRKCVYDSIAKYQAIIMIIIYRTVHRRLKRIEELPLSKRSHKLSVPALVVYAAQSISFATRRLLAENVLRLASGTKEGLWELLAKHQNYANIYAIHTHRPWAH
jgi:hypothetical protein